MTRALLIALAVLALARPAGGAELSISIPIQRGACELDGATVEYVAPGAVRTLAIYRCGAIVCWERTIGAPGQAEAVQVSLLCAESGSSGEQLRLFSAWPK